MKLLKFNASKIIVLVLTLLLSFTMIGCTDKELVAELEEAVNSITLGDTSSLKASFDIRNFTNKHNIEIKWELVEADDTLKLQKKNDDYTTVVVTPTEYEEDDEGNQINPWGKGVLVATVSKGKESVSRRFELFVMPSPKTELMNISAIKKVANQTGVEVSGTVSFIRSDGFYITDSSGSLYIYTKTAPTDDIKLGAVVLVKGKKAEYYSAPQIADPIIELVTAAPATGYDYSNVAVGDPAALEKMTTDDKDHYGKLYRITGMVITNYYSPVSGDKVSDYAIKDTLTNAVVAIYNSTDSALKSQLAGKVGKYVSLVVMAYDLHSIQKVWRYYGIPGTLVDAEAPVLTDEQIIASVVQEIETALKDKSFGTNITLISKGTAGGTVTWSSSNTNVLANDGKVTTPATNTEVTLTYTITSGDKTETGTVKVTILALQKMTVKQAIDAMDAEDTMIMIEGVIIGEDSDGYYYLADETGVVFVRNKLSADNLVVGNRVRVVATATVYNRTSEYTRQVGPNYTVEKLDNELHESPLEVVDVDFDDFDYTITKDNMETEVPKEELYGKLIRFEAYVVQRTSGNFTDPYITASLEANAPAIIIHHKSLDRDDLNVYLNMKITIIGVIYGYNGNTTGGWRFAFLNREGDVVAEFTEAQKLEIAKSEIETIVTNEKAVSGDLDFFENAKSSIISTAKYVWTSDKTNIIANDGKFNAPDADTDVVITVKVFLDGNTSGTASATYTYTVTAKAKGEVVTGGVIISQVYGGGGNSGSTYKNDFIELYNTTDQDIDITGWVVFYASKAGDFKDVGSTTYDSSIVLSGVIKAKSFFLIQANANGGGTKDLPTPDAITDIAMAKDSFKVALCNSSDTPTGPDSANIVDFVGVGSAASSYEGSGAAPTLDNENAAVRANLTDTDDNAADFTKAAPNPRNSSYKPS
jgi:uncharacterized protein YdeI (BOF family)